jgi:hypothetical protein
MPAPPVLLQLPGRLVKEVWCWCGQEGVHVIVDVVFIIRGHAKVKALLLRLLLRLLLLGGG